MWTSIWAHILQLICIPNIPHFPVNPKKLHTWIEALANIGKYAKNKAHKIISKQATLNCKAAITKYRALLNLKPKVIHKRIFSPTTTNPLDCLRTQQRNILTNPNEIFHTQTTSFQRQAPLCDDETNHPTMCTCAVRKYP